MTNDSTPAPLPEVLSALKRAMQTLCDNVGRRQGAEQVREGIQRAMPDLQIVHMALHAAGNNCPQCGWSRGHDYGCPRDPLNPGALADQPVAAPASAPLVDMGANPLRRVIQVFEEARDFCEFFGGIKDEPDDDQCSHQDHRGMFGNCCSIYDCPVLRRDAR